MIEMSSYNGFAHLIRIPNVDRFINILEMSEAGFFRMGYIIPYRGSRIVNYMFKKGIS